MKHGKTVGIVLLCAVVLLVLLAVGGAVDLVPAVVLSALAAVASIPAFLMGRIGADLERAGRRVRELGTLGLRVRGVVKDAVPYAGRHGGAVLHDEGVLMLLRVQVAREAGGTELVTLYVVEPTEKARGRIGSEVTVFEHPEDPDVRALEGFLPNGNRAWQ